MAQAATYPPVTRGRTSCPQGTRRRGRGGGRRGGIVFAVVSMIYAAAAGPGAWAPPRMIATILGFEMAPVFAAVPVVVGLVLHIILSAIYGAVFAVVIGSAARALVLAAGIAFGLALYVANFHVFAQLEQFATFRMMAGNWFEITVHAVFGLLLAVGYLRWRSHH
jgi:uncharacterized membrane protein YagU involved in acid resistance